MDLLQSYWKPDMKIDSRESRESSFSLVYKLFIVDHISFQIKIEISHNVIVTILNKDATKAG